MILSSGQTTWASTCLLQRHCSPIIQELSNKGWHWKIQSHIWRAGTQGCIFGTIEQNQTWKLSWIEIRYLRPTTRPNHNDTDEWPAGKLEHRMDGELQISGEEQQRVARENLGKFFEFHRRNLLKIDTCWISLSAMNGMHSHSTQTTPTSHLAECSLNHLAGTTVHRGLISAISLQPVATSMLQAAALSEPVGRKSQSIGASWPFTIAVLRKTIHL